MAYVYVMESDRRACKIGYSDEPMARLAELRRIHQEPIHLRFALLCGDAPLVEKKAHAALAEHHVRGEWFDVTPEVATAAVLAASSCGLPAAPLYSLLRRSPRAAEFDDMDLSRPSQRRASVNYRKRLAERGYQNKAVTVSLVAVAGLKDWARVFGNSAKGLEAAITYLAFREGVSAELPEWVAAPLRKRGLTPAQVSEAA